MRTPNDDNGTQKTVDHHWATYHTAAPNPMTTYSRVTRAAA